ncbi:MAG: translation initiation factor IF-3 [Planctomycetes bacterium]|nr:translation initiation factor IF-3 [Planctomycetota bacterium]
MAKDHRINEDIRIPQVRLVDSEGNQKGLMLTEGALRLAREAKLDLVEVAPDADPPVCKIMDYGKFKYEQKKKVHQGRTKQKVSQVKELRIRPKTEDHDLMVKVKKAKQFLENGDRVQINMLFRGREMAHIDLGKNLLERFAAEVEGFGKVEKSANLEGRRMTLLLAPNA